MSDVLINFSVDLSQLQPAIDILDQIAAKGGVIGAAWKQVATTMNAGNTSAVQGTVKLADSIDQVEQSQKDVAAQAKVTGAAIDTQNKTGIDGSDKLSKSIEGLATASKSMDKIVIGAAYKQSLKEIQDQLGLTNKEVIGFVLNARKAAQTAILTASDDQEIKDLNISIQVMNEQLKQLGVNEDGTSDKTKTLTSELRAMKDELIKMDPSNPRFEELKKEVVDTQKEVNNLNKEVKGLGSDTKNIDGLISLASGVAGGYAVAQGAAALFGNENEDVQKALLKVNAAMSILQGLQQVQNVLQKESAANILLNSAARTTQTAAVTAETTSEVANSVAIEGVTVAEGTQVVAAEAATVATRGLNLAMLANPALAVIVGVLALVTALDALNSANHLQEELQRKSNDALKEAGPILEGYIASLERQTNILVANAKLAGSNVNQIIKLQGESTNKRLALIKQESDALAKQYNDQIDLFNQLSNFGISVDKATLEAHQKLIDKKTELDKQYLDERNALEVKALEFKKQLQDDEIKSYAASLDAAVALTIAGSDTERTVRMAAIRATQADRIQAAKEQGATAGEVAKIIADDERSIQSDQLQNYQHYLKGRTSLYEGYIATAKLAILQNETDSIESINRITDLEIEAAKKRKAEALANPTLNKGEQTKIVQEANLAIAQLEKDQQLKILDIQKSGINAKLIAAEKGSQEEFDARIELMQKEQEIELSAVELAPQKRLEIDAKYRKQREDAERAFNEAQLANEVSRDNAALDRFGINEEDKLVLTIKRLQDQQAIEISQAQGNAAKVAEINAKYDKQITDAKLASINTVLTANLRAMDVLFAASVLQNNHILNDNKTTADQKLQANAVLIKMEQDKLDVELNALKKKKANELVTEEEYNVQYQDILNKQNLLLQNKTDTDLEITRAGIQKQLELVKASFDILKNGIDTLDTGSLKTGLTSVIDLFTKIKDIQNSDLSDGDKRNAEITAGVVATQGTINQLFADASAERQQQLNDNLQSLEDQKNTELDNANLTAKQKAAIEAQYAQKEKAIKQKAWEDDKQAKKEQAVINGFLAVTNALATVQPFIPAALIAAGIAASAAAIQVVGIDRAKAPRFRHGEVDIDISQWHKPYTGQVGIKGPGTATSDSIPAMISNGESVIAAKPTAKWKEVLHAINNDKFENYLTRHIHDHQFIYPHVPDHVQPHINISQKEIDYERLAAAIAAQLPEPTYVQNTMDENGMHSFVKKGNSKTEYKNKRYSMK